MSNITNQENTENVTEIGECLTIISPLATAAVFEFHRRRLSKQGFQLISKVLKHSFEIVDEDAKTTELFDGKSYYAATFIRTAEKK